jgi:hypothetical protein
VTCEELRDDLEAYALDALDAEDARAVTLHLDEGCPECNSILFDYRQAVNHLALATPLYKASPRLKQRIMGGIGAVKAPAFAVMRPQWWAATAAAVLVAFAIGGVAWAIMLSSEVSQLRGDNQRLAQLTELDADQRNALLSLQGQIMSARSEQRRMSTTLEELATLTVVALDPDLIPTEMRGTSLAPEASCNYVWSGKQDVGALTCKDMPSTATTLVYELWATKGDKNIPLGSFQPRFDGTGQLLVKFPQTVEGNVTALWVTLEELSTARPAPSSQVVLWPAPVQQAAR